MLIRIQVGLSPSCVALPPCWYPHDRESTRAGNLLKVYTSDGVNLGYLDFGLLASVPEEVREGICCAVVQLIFARNVQAVAQLFGELQLLPPYIVDDPTEMVALTESLDHIFSTILLFPEKGSVSKVPTVRFDNLLGGLLSLVARFQLTLPPYFLNNARALATLEGSALRLDPEFNVLEVVYPFALNRLLRNPSLSTVVADTTLDVMRSPQTGFVELSRGITILKETATLTSRSRLRVATDVLISRGGRRTIRRAMSITIRQAWDSAQRRRRLSK